MSITKYQPGLALSSSLIQYLRSMTSSWIRKKLDVNMSSNGMAFWDGLSIYIPDLRLSSSFNFLLYQPLEFQFSFYSALTFHEAMHAKCRSHKAKTNLLNDPEKIPLKYHSLAFFVYNLLEDGRIERIGMYKRIGSLIHSQLFRLNYLTNENNWDLYHQEINKSGVDPFIGHFLNQLFIISKLGVNFLKNYYNNSEKLIITKSLELLPNIFKSLDPNSTVHGSIKILELLKPYFAKEENNLINNYIELLSSHSINKQESSSSKSDLLFDLPKIDFNSDLYNEIIQNPFNPNEKSQISNLIYNTNNDNLENEFNSINKSEDQELTNKMKKDGRKKLIKSKINQSLASHMYKGRSKSISKEITEFKQFLNSNHMIQPVTSSISHEEEQEYFIDIFGNDSIIESDTTIWEYLSDNLEEIIDYNKENFDYDRLNKIARITANTFLKLAGINIKKKINSDTKIQKIIINGQKNGKLKLSGQNLSQLLAGNEFIKIKEIPAKLKIEIDLVILVDLTGSMGFETQCDGRIAERMEFANEATIVLTEFLEILASEYHLPIQYSIIGYSADYNEVPTLQVMKKFNELYQNKQHAEAIYSWVPDGENCDARAIYESTNLFDDIKSKSLNKTIFFLSDGGGEEKDYFVIDQITKEFPKFKQKGPKDLTDAINYASMKKVSVNVFMMEAINDFELNHETLDVFRKYYGQNVNIIGQLNELIESFSSNLFEIFKLRR